MLSSNNLIQFNRNIAVTIPVRYVSKVVSSQISMIIAQPHVAPILINSLSVYHISLTSNILMGLVHVLTFDSLTALPKFSVSPSISTATRLVFMIEFMQRQCVRFKDYMPLNNSLLSLSIFWTTATDCDCDISTPYLSVSPSITASFKSTKWRGCFPLFFGRNDPHEISDQPWVWMNKST